MLVSDWESRYRSRHTPWDLGGPTPVFTRLIAEKRLEPGRLLVPGAGRGYDAVAFAKAGFEVTAVDIAPTACEELRDLAAREGTHLQVLEADFFELEELQAYDAMLEYTFYCAIAPERREAYRDKAAGLLRPGGILFGLFFPLKGVRDEGPPFPLDVEEIKWSFEPRFELLHDEDPPDSIKPRKGNERLMIWRKH